MEHTKDLDDLHKKSVDKIDEYINTKDNLSEEHHEKLTEAKKKWQAAWLELQQYLMYLETLEI
ncbi:MAG: hypothetical protein ACTHNG_05220 [Ginsengibacter sp.]